MRTQSKQDLETQSAVEHLWSRSIATNIGEGRLRVMRMTLERAGELYQKLKDVWAIAPYNMIPPEDRDMMRRCSVKVPRKVLNVFGSKAPEDPWEHQAWFGRWMGTLKQGWRRPTPARSS